MVGELGIDQARRLLTGGLAGVREWNLWRRKAMLVPPQLDGIDLSGALLNGANLSDLRLRGANLDRAKLRDAVLVGSDLQGASLREASLVKANLCGARLTDAQMERAHLRNALLRRAVLTGANLEGAELNHSQLIEAKLAGCRMESSFLMEADFTGAELHGARLTGAYMARCRLRRARLGGADLSRASLKAADLTRAALISTVLNGADLTGANLSQAELRCVDFQNTRMRDTVLSDVDLSDLSAALSSVVHLGPSLLSTSSLIRSRGKVPPEFLKGCGLQDWEVAATQLYNPSLNDHELAKVQAQVAVLRRGDTRAHRPVFLAFGASDRPAADLLGTLLDEAGLRCWQDSKDEELEGGDSSIRRGIRDDDVVFLFLSNAALASQWLMSELRLAEKQRKDRKRYTLCPLIVDPEFARPARSLVARLLDQHRSITLAGMSRTEIEQRLQPVLLQLELARAD